MILKELMITHIMLQRIYFAEPAIDMAYDEEVSIDAGALYFAVEYLPDNSIREQTLQSNA